MSGIILDIEDIALYKGDRFLAWKTGLPWLIFFFTINIQLINIPCRHWFQIISWIWQFLTTSIVNTLPWATIISHLNYFNSLLTALPASILIYAIAYSQCSIQWSRSGSKSKPGHVIPLLQTLPISHRRKTKVLQCSARPHMTWPPSLLWSHLLQKLPLLPILQPPWPPCGHSSFKEEWKDTWRG